MEQMQKWRTAAVATGPADRAAAEDGIRLAYRSAGLAEPERIVWADSPLAGVRAVRALGDAGRSVRDEVRTRPWAQERRRLHDELGPAGWTALWGRTGAALWDTTRDLADRIREAVAERIAEEERPAGQAPAPAGEAAGDAATGVRLLLLDAVLGQHDAAWLAAFDGRGDRLAGLARVAGHAGWWWPYEKAAVVCERPAELHRDELGRLGSGVGPALAFSDGFALHAWRGMPVPADFPDRLASLTAERIRTEENAELRRVMLEFYGYDRYLDESGAQPVHRDEAGVLWRIALEGDEDVAMVEVVNSTAEPDGTFRTYWLRVPPRTRTAKEGVAWTFGLDEADYEPLVQT
ncbi:DUF6745 domain-containing protein [Streptomyces yaizuensis]|uniref:DUF6745 domain-containing protein n=1 Tax=Streptomyces yaizuensis TaxID=2989713 RepID=A0ABQ5P793_9ACTN|nr:hypothetical protein [Streptomyces sp. YSPA8]GLF98458.1 hypothetical protein SYYSPA8_29195 [Streptomyces sp. YSPA8]